MWLIDIPGVLCTDTTQTGIRADTYSDVYNACTCVKACVHVTSDATQTSSALLYATSNTTKG